MKQKWCVPCLRGSVGDWIYYSTLMSAEQIDSHISTSKNIREAKVLDDFIQRTLRERFKNIATYLKRREDRFFNSIIVGVFDELPDWVQFDLSSMANNLEMPEISKVEDSLGLLIFFGNEKMFAIDGQHRVAGIKAALNDVSDDISSDEFSVIFVAHKDDKEGKVRTRRLFSDINNNAVKVSDGDKVVIDEDDICAIVSRRVFSSYPPFADGSEIAVTEKKEQVIKEGKEYFTSLLALYTVIKVLRPLFKKPANTLESDPENVANLQQIAEDFLNFVIDAEPSFHSYFKLRDTTLAEQRVNNRNLFFRPIGLDLLSRLYKHFRLQGKLGVLASALGSDTRLFYNPKGIWDGILWNSGRIEASAKARNVAFQLTLYLLNESKAEDEVTLLDSLREIRKDANYLLPPKLSIAETNTKN